MRFWATVFLILSPFIAIAQNDHLGVAIPVLQPASVTHFAEAAVTNADLKMSALARAVQEALS